MNDEKERLLIESGMINLSSETQIVFVIDVKEKRVVGELSDRRRAQIGIGHDVHSRAHPI